MYSLTVCRQIITNRKIKNKMLLNMATLVIDMKLIFVLTILLLLSGCTIMANDDSEIAINETAYSVDNDTLISKSPKAIPGMEIAYQGDLFNDGSMVVIDE